MLRIPVPTPNTSQVVSLGGVAYNFVFNFNYFDDKWRISIYQNEEPVQLNMKVTEPKSLIRVRTTPVNFSHGDLQVHQRKTTSNPCGIDNFGIDKEYELLYFTNEELDL